MHDVSDDGSPHGSLEFAVVDPANARGRQLREDLLETWVAVTDAGGSVGFIAPADRAQIAETLDSALERVADGSDVLGVLTRAGTVVGMGFLVDNGSPLQRHWRILLRLMVRPELQGSGAGRALLEGLHQTARELGLEQLQLTVRDGHGLERFYERFGYAIVGHHPGAVRVGPGDDRDEVMMVARLGPRPAPSRSPH
jgi:GNAT superfamily N-acetyltransferase